MAQLNNIHDLEAYKNRVKEKSRLYVPLQSGGGNGTGGGMETRVAKLESDVDHIKNDVAEIKSDVRDMKKDVQSIKENIAEMRGENKALAAEMRGANEALAAEMRGLHNIMIVELNNKVSWKGLFTATLAIIAAIPTIILLAPWIGKLLQ